MSVHPSHQCPCGSGLHESDCRCTVADTDMTSVYYAKLRMWGQVEHMPEAGVVLVFWDKGGSTRIPVGELEVRT